MPTRDYAFDSLEPQGHDVRDHPLVQRRARLQALLARTKSELLRFGDSFPDANAMLAGSWRLDGGRPEWARTAKHRRARMLFAVVEL